MTEKQKAKELVEEMFNEQPESYDEERIKVDRQIAKRCAIIICDEVISQYIDNNCETARYYEKVKEEIINMP